MLTGPNYEKTVKEQQGIINRIFSYFPEIKEKLGIIRMCEVIRLGADLIKSLLSENRLAIKGELYSPEYKRHFRLTEPNCALKEARKNMANFA